MPRRYFEDGVEIVIEDFNSLSAAIERGLYDRFVYELFQRQENAFFDDSFKVTFASANSVTVKKGNGLMSDTTATSPEPKIRPLYLAADSNVVISSPHSVNDRIDIVCVKASLVTELTGSRKKKDAQSSTISTQSLIVQKDWQADIVITAGTPGVSPAVPATPSGYVKIAELYVTAVTGMSGAGAVTDKRTLMPVGSQIKIDTTGKTRITAGASTTLAQILTDIDGFLKNGKFQYFDLEELDSTDTPADPEPGSPATDFQRMFYRDGVLYLKDSSGNKSPVGSGGGGGGGGANWQGVAGIAAVEDFEFDEKVWKFAKGEGQMITLWVRVPASYISGRQIKMKAAFYSLSSANNWKMNTSASLVRKNLDPIDYNANVALDTSGDMTNTVAKQMREVPYNLTDSTGKINGFAVSPGDILKLVMNRQAPSAGTEDTGDIRFIPSSTEVLFS